MDLYPPIDQLTNVITDDTVYFFVDGIGTLNHWSAHSIDIWGERFATVEHAYHYKKFVKTNPAVAKQIKQARSPYEAMKIARQHKADAPADWYDHAVELFTELDRAKFAQNQDACEVLLATGDRKLVENSPWDPFWGCGADGNGQNMAGNILMKVRSELRASTA